MNKQMKELMKDLKQVREKMAAKKDEASTHEMFEMFLAEHEIMSSLVFRMAKEDEDTAA